jgi:hypothetical protein
MPRKVKLYQELAALQTAYYNNLHKKETYAGELTDKEYVDIKCWLVRHEVRINEFCEKYLPSGSGIDGRPHVLLREELCECHKVQTERLIINDADFHHMDENGGYDGWTAHTVIVTPSLQFGFNLRITGRNRNGIKDYLYPTFEMALNKTIMLNNDGSHHEVQD